MRRFSCPNCSNEVHFSNIQCVQCSSLLGYLPSGDHMLVLADDHSPCRNRESISCNWICETGARNDLCLSCAHTTKIPNIADDANRLRWQRLEREKRRLLYAVIKFGLPLEAHVDGSDGFLHFELLGDELGKVDEDGNPVRVMTGHSSGKITININEADDAIREKNRVAMGEPYRTLIGHFRHEIAHFYWDKLVAGQPSLDGFRACFGDESADYSEALKKHYENGPPQDWQQSFVSAYASAHPWEDFAETWAHYFHMVAGLETAHAYGIDPQSITGTTQPQATNPYHVDDLQQLLNRWVPLTVAMNAMNRSIGNTDFYPFVLSDTIFRKLSFMHTLIGCGR